MPTKAKKPPPVAAVSAPQVDAPAVAAAKAPAGVKRTAAANKPAPTKATAAVKKPVPAKTTATSKAVKPGVEAPAKAEKKKASPKRPKLVRDSFTFPVDDYARIAELKERTLGLGREVKKSELLRAGLNVLSSLTDQKLVAAVDALVKIKTGRPGKK